VGRFWEADYVAALAAAYLGLGDSPRARRLADEAIEIALRMAAGRRGSCPARPRAGIDRARRRGIAGCDRNGAGPRYGAGASTGAISYEPQILVERARLAELSGDSAGRTDLIREAHRLFTAMGATGRAERIATELS
jgi:hypothetical protein